MILLRHATALTLAASGLALSGPREASHTRGCIRMAASRPSISSRWWTIALHHRSLMLLFSSTPSGP